jgi:bifunctional N-acetylglucosamine-1-phosphate-uridyltransferase/glucosamine-1-phosphate-acetyltransferase GlmU-like protein
MSLILSATQSKEQFGMRSTPSQWTAIIPAAGRGTRLGYSLPKLLYQVNGKTLAAHLVDLLRPFCAQFVFIVSPEGRDSIEQELLPLSVPFQLCLQDKPKGMADAIQCARDQVKTPFSVVVWGDQIALKESTICLGMAAHENRPFARVTVPTILKSDPYIHFERNAEGRIVKVLQARESSIPHKIGENDAGVFFFSSVSLFEELERARAQPLGTGQMTGEFNLLQILPVFEDEKNGFCTLRIIDEEETIGINTLDDSIRVSEILTKRSSNQQGSR